MIALKNIIVTVCLFLFPAVTFAQSSIDKVVESLEDDKNVQDVMYSEQRDPSTRKIVKSSRIIKFSSDKIAAKLISAFKKEREKAISYKATNRPSNSVYELSFNDGKGFTAKYTLVQQGSSRWMLSVSILHNRNRKHRSRDVTYNNDCENVFSNDDDTFMSLVVEDYAGDLNDDNDCEKIRIARETESGCETLIIHSKSKASNSRSSRKSQSNRSSSSKNVTVHRYL